MQIAEHPGAEQAGGVAHHDDFKRAPTDQLQHVEQRTPTDASKATPTSVPRKVASNPPDRPRPGASNAPVCNTIKPMPRENHRENRSRAPKTRWSAGTAESGEYRPGTFKECVSKRGGQPCQGLWPLPDQVTAVEAQ